MKTKSLIRYIAMMVGITLWAVSLAAQSVTPSGGGSTTPILVDPTTVSGSLGGINNWTGNSNTFRGTLYTSNIVNKSKITTDVFNGNTITNGNYFGTNITIYGVGTFKTIVAETITNATLIQTNLTVVGPADFYGLTTITNMPVASLGTAPVTLGQFNSTNAGFVTIATPQTITGAKTFETGVPTWSNMLTTANWYGPSNVGTYIPYIKYYDAAGLFTGAIGNRGGTGIAMWGPPDAADRAFINIAANALLLYSATNMALAGDNGVITIGHTGAGGSPSAKVDIGYSTVPVNVKGAATFTELTTITNMPNATLNTAPVTLAQLNASNALYVVTNRVLTAGSGLTGGGGLDADRTFTVDWATTLLTNNLFYGQLTGINNWTGTSNTFTGNLQLRPYSYIAVGPSQTNMFFTTNTSGNACTIVGGTPTTAGIDGILFEVLGTSYANLFQVPAGGGISSFSSGANLIFASGGGSSGNATLATANSGTQRDTIISAYGTNGAASTFANVIFKVGNTGTNEAARLDGNKTLILSGGLMANRVATGTNYITAPGDFFVSVKATSGIATQTTTLHQATQAGRLLVIKDGQAVAGTTNILINCSGGQTIDGAATYTINANKGAVNLIYDGVSNWEVW